MQYNATNSDRVETSLDNLRSYLSCRAKIFAPQLNFFYVILKIRYHEFCYAGLDILQW